TGSSYSGGTTINGGSVVLTASSASGAVTGIGTATVAVNSGGVLEVSNIAAAISSTINNGGTLRGTGANTQVRGQQFFGTSGNMTLSAPNTGDLLSFTAAVRNSGAGGQSSSAIITASGNGIIKLG